MATYYDPYQALAAAQQGQQQAMARLMSLASARQQFAQQEREKMEAEQMRRMQEQEAEISAQKTNWLDDVGQGAMMGSVGGPVGALVGGGLGLLKGGLESYQENKRLRGGKGGWGAFADTVKSPRITPEVLMAGAALGGRALGAKFGGWGEAGAGALSNTKMMADLYNAQNEADPMTWHARNQFDEAYANNGGYAYTAQTPVPSAQKAPQYNFNPNPDTMNYWTKTPDVFEPEEYYNHPQYGSMKITNG